jgi:DNA-binding MarR family transcriptional regulator
MAVSSERITRALELAGKMDVCDAGRTVLLDLLVDSLSLQQTQALGILGQAGRDWVLPGTVREQMRWKANHTSNILKRLCELGLAERRRALVGYEYRARRIDGQGIACGNSPQKPGTFVP